MDERIIIGEVVEETPMGNPVCVIFTDPFARCKVYKRVLVFPIIQARKEEDAEIFMFTASLN